MRLPPTAFRHRTGHTTAFRGEEVFVAAVPDRVGDAFLAPAVIDRGVDVVYAGVEHRVQDRARLIIVSLSPAESAAQLHRAVTERCDLKTGSAKLTGRQFGHAPSFLNW